MKTMLPRLMLLATCALLGGLPACSPASGAHDDDPAADPPVGPTEAGVLVTIVGAGTVAYGAPGVADCAAPGPGSQACAPVRYTGGDGTLTATPATGWKLAGWSLTYPSSSPNAITQPDRPSQEVVVGTSVALTVTFVPLVHAITATFDQGAYATTYHLDVENPDLDVVKVEWSGPNCGDWGPQDPQLGSEPVTGFDMTWHHPHPPCDATTDHHEVVVLAKVTIKDKTFTCGYQGAGTGVGPACK